MTNSDKHVVKDNHVEDHKQKMGTKTKSEQAPPAGRQDSKVENKSTES